MKRIVITTILTLALTAFAIQAVEQTAFSGAGIIESTTGGFKFPDGSVQTVATPSDLEARIVTLEESSQSFVVVTEQSRTVAIPGEYADLNEAFAALQKEHINPGTKITLQLDAGTYNRSAPLELNHPDGISIEILGDLATPSNVVLDFNNSSGLILSGTYLSLIDGVTILGNQTGAPYDKMGIKASAGATVNVGNNVIVEGFDIGMQAEFGGVIMAEQTTVSGNVLHGYVAVSGGIINANGAIATYNGGSGFAAFYGSNISVDAGTSNDNGDFGYVALGHSIINATAAAASGNSTADYNLTPNTLSADGSIVIQ